MVINLGVDTMSNTNREREARKTSAPAYRRAIDALLDFDRTGELAYRALCEGWGPAGADDGDDED